MVVKETVSNRLLYWPDSTQHSFWYCLELGVPTQRPGPHAFDGDVLQEHE